MIEHDNGVEEFDIRPEEKTESRRSGKYLSVSEWVRVTRDDNRCRRCGLDNSNHDGDLHVHHLTPEVDARDHPHRATNLVTLCKSCHQFMEHKSREKQLQELSSADRDVNSNAILEPLPSPEDLREVDRHLLDYLSAGRVTPAFARKRLDADDVGEYSRGYVQQRLARLEEHSHLVNLEETGLYELVDDPREGSEDGA